MKYLVSTTYRVLDIKILKSNSTITLFFAFTIALILVWAI